MFSVSNRGITPEQTCVAKNGYVSGYYPTDSSQTTWRQWSVLQALIPGLKDPDFSYFSIEKSEKYGQFGFEKSFVLPHWSLLAPSYSEAIVCLIRLLSQTRNGKVDNLAERLLNEQRLREIPIKTQLWKELIETQGSKVVVVPGQFGGCIVGKSMKDALASSLFYPYSANVFQVCFGLYEALIMLITHQNRLNSEGDLWLSLPGDQCSADLPNVFHSGPIICYRDGNIVIDFLDVNEKLPELGTVSGFLIY